MSEIIFSSSVKHWWDRKRRNATDIDKSQGGSRDQNLRGDTMDGFRDAIINKLSDAGVDVNDIYCGSQLSKLASNLPSYYRATKNWDIIVCKDAHHKKIANSTLHDPTLIAAIEFKSQYESIGNNQNNRMEESIGNAHDFWASYENKNFFRLTPRPWLGYLFLGLYADGDENGSVEINQPIIPSDPIFVKETSTNNSYKITGVSYAKRYQIFLERMIAKKLYDSACFLVTHNDISDNECNYRVIYPELSGEQFIDSLIRYIRAYYF